MATVAVSVPEKEAPARWPTLSAWALVIICGAIGLLGFVWRFIGGHAAADYGSYVPWGLWISAYVALVGASAGAFGLAAVILMQRRTEHYELAHLAMLVAFGAFVAGMVNVWVDLGHPFRAWELLADTSWGSVMGLMAWLYTIYGIVLIVGLWATRKGEVPRYVEVFSPVAFFFAILFAGAEGALFGAVGARPLWESGLTPVLFLVEAALFGTALVTAAAVFFGVARPSAIPGLRGVLLVLLGALLLIEFAEYSIALLASVPAKEEAVREILFGDFWWVFWIFHLGLGMIVPGILLLVGRSRSVLVGVAGALIGAMSIASKLNLLIPALAQEELEGLEDAFTGPGLTYDYFPTAMEWMVWLGTVALAGFVVLAGWRLLGGSRSAPSVGTDDSPALEPQEVS